MFTYLPNQATSEGARVVSLSSRREHDQLHDFPWKDERESSSVRRTLELFQRQLLEISWETRWNAYGLFRAHRYHLELDWTEHVSTLLRALHWLPICQRINYKLLFICLSNYWLGSSTPCWHHPDLCSFPTTPFFLWHSSVSKPFCQKKVIWLTHLCITRPGRNSRATSGMLLLPSTLSKLFLKINFFRQENFNFSFKCCCCFFLFVLFFTQQNM